MNKNEKIMKDYEKFNELARRSQTYLSLNLINPVFVGCYPEIAEMECAYEIYESFEILDIASKELNENSNKLIFSLQLIAQRRLNPDINEKHSSIINSINKYKQLTDDALNKFNHHKKIVTIDHICSWYLREGIDSKGYEMDGNLTMNDFIKDYFFFSDEEEKIYLDLAKSRYFELDEKFRKENTPIDKKEVYFFMNSSHCKVNLGLLFYFASNFKLDETLYKLYREYEKHLSQLDLYVKELISELLGIFSNSKIDNELIHDFNLLCKLISSDNDVIKENLWNIYEYIYHYADDKFSFDLLFELKEYLNK